MAPAALPRALVLSLLLVAASTAAWAQEEASSPISMPPASGPTGASPLLDQQLDSAVAPASVSSSQPPASSASSPSAADAPSDGVSAATHASPPVPFESPAPAPAAAADRKEADKAPTPAPGAAHKEADKDKDKEEEEEEGCCHKKKKKKAPAPAPAAAQVKAVSGEQAATGDAQAEEGSHEEMNGGKKAGVVVGAFTAAAVVGLGAFVWKKRRANIRRARYAEYSARLEMA